MRSFAILFGLVALVTIASAIPDRLICYYGSWATYHEGNARVDVEDLTTDNVCTHLIYSFIGLNYDGSIKILDYWNEIEQDALGRFSRLKNQNPNVKLMISIGGWSEGSDVFSQVTDNPGLRGRFVQESVDFMYKYNLDGFDVDWEYPAANGGRPQDFDNYVNLIRELRNAFNNAGRGWLLTSAVGADTGLTWSSYNVPEMNRYLDWIGLMTYDYTGGWSSTAGFNAPLYAVQNSVNGWIDRGADPAKLVMGVGTYGQAFTLSNPAQNWPGAPVNGGGGMDYRDICQRINQGWTRQWDNPASCPYAFSGNQWVGYDDVDSVAIKTQWAKQRGLGGIMVWSFDLDDLRNICGGGRLPLLHSIRWNLQN